MGSAFAIQRRGRGAQWYWHHHRFATVERLLPQPCDRLLDLGCGPGTFLGTRSDRFRSGLGIDLAGPQIDYAKRTYGRPNLTFETADVRSFVGRATFDAVVSIEVIEHLPRAETQPFLSTIRELLAPGGTVVLTTPNYRSLWPLIERSLSRIGPIDYTRQHINPFSVERLVRELTEAGFRNVRSETFFVVSPFAAALSNALANGLLHTERALLPWLGSEIAVRAERPA